MQNCPRNRTSWRGLDNLIRDYSIRLIMNIGTKLLVLVLASVLIGTVAAANLQQTYAPRGCDGCIAFKKLTHEFEKGVIAAIEDPENIPEALNAYSQNVQRIFIGDPGIDQVRTLLQSYEQDVTTLFDTREPIPGNQLVKEFRSLTHDFEKAVIGLQTPPEPDTPA
jgi:hypothetical protein